MRLLLDTHALAWWLADHPDLSSRARAVIADLDNDVWASAAAAGAMSWEHRDPWDRLLMAQASLSEFTLVTKDAVFARYGLATLW